MAVGRYHFGGFLVRSQTICARSIASEEDRSSGLALGGSRLDNQVLEMGPRMELVIQGQTNGS